MISIFWAGSEGWRETHGPAQRSQARPPDPSISYRLRRSGSSLGSDALVRAGGPRMSSRPLTIMPHVGEALRSQGREPLGIFAYSESGQGSGRPS
jgi:hypothetical protein